MVEHALCVRIMQLTYNPRNLIGDGCGEKTDFGLSKFGRKVVEEMNRIRIVIDLLHVGHKSANEAIDLSKDPVIFSHSNTKALADVNRNITDCQIKDVAEKDGEIGVGSPSFSARQGKLDEICALKLEEDVDSVGPSLWLLPGKEQTLLLQRVLGWK